MAGGDRFKIGEEAKPVADAKLSLTETDIQDFIRSPHSAVHESVEAINSLATEIRRSLAQATTSTRFKYGYNFTLSVNEYGFTVAGIEKAIEGMRASLPQTPAERDPDHRKIAPTLAPAHDQISHLRVREMDRLVKYVQLLYEFYQCEAVHQRIAAIHGKKSADQFRKTVERQAESRAHFHRRHISVAVDDSSSDEGCFGHVAETGAFAEILHILIDEAQYYHPLVLRLFAALARLDETPQGTMTIVGDLEQLVSLKGGLVRWEDAGLAIPPENINKLRINYRSSRQVFEFLKVYRDIAGIAEELVKPRLWYSGEGVRPEIRRCSDRDAEIDCIAERISQIRTASDTEKWTIAIVVPDSLISTVAKPLIAELKSYAVGAREASGEDVKESTDKVIVTDYDSIVGLEFDAVFLLGCEEALNEGHKEEVQAAWVALSRPRLFRRITHVGPVKVFGDSAFDAFRTDGAN